MKISENKTLSLAFRILLSLSVSFFGQVFITLACGVAPGSGVSGILRLSFGSVTGWIRTVILFGLVLFLLSAPKSLWDFLYKYRYPAALIVFLAAVAIGLNGSSIGYWNMFFEKPDAGVIFGRSRAARTDEWALFTPMTLAQYMNPNGAFSYFNPLFRGVDTDMFLLYGQPAWDIGVLFRPFSWGYLFLPFGNGLGWYWVGRFLSLFLVSLEFGRLLSNDKRHLSVSYAILLALSPFVQWWFSINGLVEMLIAMQFSVLLFRKYLREEHTWKRALYFAGILWCAGAFILAIYPAWMIPLFYLLLVFVAFTIFEGRAEFRKIRLLDILLALLLTAAFSGIMLHVFLKSKETIHLIMNSAYPGKDREGSGSPAIRRFISQYIASLWYPVEGVISEAEFPVNSVAQVLSFSPLPQVLFVLLYVREKKKDVLGTVLLVLGIFGTVWSVTEWPAVFNRITFLSNSSGGRLMPVISMINMMLLVRTLSLSEKPFSLPLGIGTGAGCAAAIAAYHYFAAMTFSWTKLLFATCLIFMLSMSLLTLLTGREKLKKYTLSMILLLSFMAGGMVNPIRIGAKDVTEDPVLQMIRLENEKEEGLWAVEGGYPETNIPVLSGARCLNSTNIYMVPDRWETIDPKGEAEEIYNRYAHIKIEVKTEGDAEFELLNPDYFGLRITISDLKKLGVSYVLSRGGSPVLEDAGCKTLVVSGKFVVYRLP